MPAKNIIKIYVENGYYHLYNRGVEKRNIFLDEQDYKVFLHYLKIFLSPPPSLTELASAASLIGSPFVRLTPIKPLDKEIILLSYVLLRNHFHLLVKQITKQAITQFMRKVCTGYAMYFNKKYQRVGTLFQGRFKASLIDSNIYLLHLTRYIHQNPLTILKPNQKLENYPYSSLPNYLGKTEQKWVNTQEILSTLKEEFGKNETYQKFMNTKETPSYLSDVSLVLEENLA